MKKTSTVLFMIIMMATVATVVRAQQGTTTTGPFQLTPLPYEYNALEPYIDAQTVQLHHDKHFGAAVTILNTAVKGTEAEKMSVEEILANTKKFDIKIRNNAGSVYAHDQYFAALSPKGGGEPTGELASAINAAFANFEMMKTKMNDAALDRYGSGWAWLYVAPNGKLAICSTPNQDNPMMDVTEAKGKPILGIDVWEHAYYLKYQNKRGDYLNAIWNIINWDEVSRRFAAAKK
jgi:Fe-Mn family superoxide dismutase